MADIKGPYQDEDGARVGGFLIKKFQSTPGTKEEDSGKIQIILEADKSEIATGAYDLGDIIKAINVHQEARQPVVVRVLINSNTPVKA